MTGGKNDSESALNSSCREALILGSAESYIGVVKERKPLAEILSVLGF